MALSSEHLPSGTVIGGDFTIVRRLAEGGMGTVYIAVQQGTGAQRALKVMRSSLLDDTSLYQRFEQEARVGSLIKSDHVVHVVSAGVDDALGIPWIAMELLEGRDLGAALKEQGVIEPSDAYLILSQLCHALTAAHEVGVVHRDLKPENIFLAASRTVGMPFVVKALDFGVAKLLSEAKGATMLIGTPSYMAPEQSQRTELIGPQTDLWALGLIFFRMLTGRAFWRAVDDVEASPAMLLREVLVDPIPPASARAAEYKRDQKLPEGFDDWFARCVTRDINDRFPTAASAHAALAPLLAASSERATTGVRLTSTFGPATAKVTYRDRSEKIIVEAPRGQSILDVSLHNRIPHARACNGKAQCTTCRVAILDGSEHLSGRSEGESVIAKEEGWPDNIRLACQARIRGDVALRRLVVDADEPRDPGAGAAQTLPAVERSVVALFCGIRSFRSLALGSYPHDVVHIVTRYLRQIGEPITSNRGTVERSAGERVVALFGTDGGSPLEAATDALRASLRIAARIKHFNQSLVRTFGHELEIGLGLHYGSVVMGQIHPGKAHLTALGDVDEIAMRVERAAHAAGVLIGASPAFLRVLQHEVRTGTSFHVETRPGETPFEAVEIIDFVKPDAVLIVQSTFERVAPRADEVARHFYEQLFELSTEVEGLFDHVNMQAQRKMLMDVLAIAVRSLDRLDELLPTLRELGRRHARYGVRVAHYKIVGEALLGALGQYFQSDFTPEVELAWREIYGILAKTMIDASKGPGEQVAVA